MRLELLGAPEIVPSINVNVPKPLPVTTVNYKVPISTVPTKPPFLTMFTEGLTKIVNTVTTIKQVFNPSGQVVESQTSLDNDLQVKEDNTMLYVGFGVGGALLLVGLAVAISRKKKKRGIGRVKRKSTRRRRR